MDKLLHAPSVQLQPEQDKDTNFQPFNQEEALKESTGLKPAFDLRPFSSDPLSAEGLTQHLTELTQSTTRAVPHSEILKELLEQCTPLDFEALAFPEAEKLRQKLKDLDNKLTNPDGSINNDKAFDRERELWKDTKKKLDKLRLARQHYLILTIEEVTSLAQKYRWDLCKNLNFIYLYNGAFWKELDREELQGFLGGAAEKLGVDKYSARYYLFREHLFKQFMATAYLPTPESPTDTVRINLLNGTFEITPNGTSLRGFDRSDFITYQLPFEYNPNASAPLFQEYINRVLPDVERQRVLAEYMGYLFIKNGSKALKEEKALILYGSGANGKSVFFEIVNALLGVENVSSYSLQDLTNEGGHHRAAIANKLVNYASEINGKLETSIFKQLVSGEPVTARVLYCQPFTMKQYAKLIFNCNELPKEVENTNAYFRRFLIIPFDVTIPEAEQDKQLHTKIIEQELSGVFNWVLDGLKRLLAQGRFSTCEAAQKALEDYKTQSDSVKLFLQEREYESSPTDHLLIQELYESYRSFCSDDGMKPVSKTNFRKRLTSCGVVTERKNIGNVAFLKRKSLPF